jgi:hypothetical protein
LVTPGEGLGRAFGIVDVQMNEVQGNKRGEEITARMAIAQVAAISALTHAVRELTAEVRLMRLGSAQSEPGGAGS